MTQLKHNQGAFTVFSKKVSSFAGKPLTFIAALLIVIVWASVGPFFKYSDTWQLVINTGTTIITFLMVFLIQNTQNRDTTALQLKLDELIRSMNGAHTVLLDIEELSDEELSNIREKYEDIASEARKRLRAGKSDTNIPSVIIDEDFELK